MVHEEAFSTAYFSGKMPELPSAFDLPTSLKSLLYRWYGSWKPNIKMLASLALLPQTFKSSTAPPDF